MGSHEGNKPEAAKQTPAPAADQDEPVAQPDGLSAFASHVLNQLSLSAWLPGAFLATGVTVLYLFRQQGSLDIAGLMPRDAPGLWALALLAGPTLVLATLITQAFGFESIRLLEGYWHRRGPAAWMSRAMIRWQRRRKKAIHDARLAESVKAFDKTMPLWVSRASSTAILTELRAVASEEPLPKGHRLKKKERAEFLTYEWDEYIEPWEQRRLEGLERSEGEFPEDNRILPTRLGNIIRSTEDRLTHVDGDIEQFSMQRRELVPPRVRLHHDQFRTRLDMYCTLVFVALALALATPLMLVTAVSCPWRPWAWTLSGALLALAWVAYQAALSSGRGYAAVLRRMDQ